MQEINPKFFKGRLYFLNKLASYIIFGRFKMQGGLTSALLMGRPSAEI